MAVVSRIARVRITAATGGFLEYTATATVQDTPAGASVVVTMTRVRVGLGAPDDPNNPIELIFYIDDSATVIKVVTFESLALPQNDTFFFTVDGLIGGAARFGTVRMRVRAEKTNGGPTATYHVDSDGTNNTPPTGGSTQLDQGWIRATQTATVTASNIAAGGAKTEPAQRNEVVYHRAVVQAVGYSSYATVHTFTGTSKSITVTSSSATRDATFTGTGLANGRVNYGFPAADATYTATVSLTTNSALTGLPIGVLSSVTDDTLQVDPRYTAVHLFQLGDNSIGTPPLSKNDLNKERSGSVIGYLGTGIHAARGGVAGDVMSGGVNGLTIDITLTAPNGTVLSRTDTTGNEGGEDGWTSGFMEWTSQLPGGLWDKLVDITGPADAGDSSYVLNSTDALLLIGSPSPFVTLTLEIGHADGSKVDAHITNGDTIEANLYFKRTKVGDQRLLEADTTNLIPQISFERVSGNDVLVYDDTLGAWVSPVSGALLFTELTQVSTYVWRLVVTSDVSWGDVIATAIAQYDGIQYTAGTPREMVGAINSHRGYAFNPLAKAGFT